MKNNTALIFAIATVITVGIVVGLKAAMEHRALTAPEVARQAGRPIPVRVAAAEMGTVEERIGSECVVKESAIVAIRAPVVAQVLKIHADLADLVKEGQVLVELDDSLQSADLELARAQLRHAENENFIASKALKETRALFERELVSQQDLDAAERDYDKARYELARAKNAVVHKQIELASTKIVSPISGIVMSREVHPGVIPKPDTEMLAVSVLDPVLVQCELNEEKYRAVHIGQSAEILFYALSGQRLSSSVLRIDPQVDEITRNISVWLRLANADMELRPGMRGVVDLLRSENGLRIPSVALINQRVEEAEVFAVDEEGVAHFQTIGIGAVGQGYAIVKQGLSEGERVVIVGQVALQDGDHVRIGEEYEEARN